MEKTEKLKAATLKYKNSDEIRSRDQAAALVKQIAHWTVIMGCTSANQRRDVLLAQGKHQLLINQLTSDISMGTTRLEAWARENLEEFTGQTLELPNGFLRFRKGRRSLDVRPGWQWSNVLAALTGPFKKYRRETFAPDKVKILQDSAGEDPALTNCQLKSIGIKVVQEESFEVEVKPEASVS